jgi:hypothetical protein
MQSPRQLPLRRLLSGISSGAPNENQPLFVKATLSNPLLIATPTVAHVSPSSTGTLTLTPVWNQTGTATITVTVNDGWPNTTTRSFNVTVSSLPKISGLVAEALDARTMRIGWNINAGAIDCLGREKIRRPRRQTGNHGAVAGAATCIIDAYAPALVP